MASLISRAQAWCGQYLDPVDALTEEVCGVVTALTITLGAGLVVEEGDQATRQLLLGILGCNLAYGIVDGTVHLFYSMMERSSKARLLLSIQGAANQDEAMAMVQGELDPELAPLTSPEERRRIYSDVLVRLRNVAPERTTPTREDVYGSLLVFALVFLSSLPAVVPFLVIDDRFIALRVSNSLQLVLLFGIGYIWARRVHANPWKFGLYMLLGGVALVAITMALGG